MENRYQQRFAEARTSRNDTEIMLKQLNAKRSAAGKSPWTVSRRNGYPAIDSGDERERTVAAGLSAKEVVLALDVALKAMED